MNNFKDFYTFKADSIINVLAENLATLKKISEESPFNYKWVYEDEDLVKAIKIARNGLYRELVVASRIFSIDRYNYTLKIKLVPNKNRKIKTIADRPYTCINSIWKIDKICETINKLIDEKDQKYFTFFL